MKIALVAAELEENLSVRYLWGALCRHGHEVVLCRFNQAEDISSIARELTDSKADIAGFSMVFTYRSREFAAVASAARELGYKGHIVAGGHFAAFNAERLLRDCQSFDSVAIGEGEGIISELADNKACPQNVPGLIWRDRRGNIVKNQPARPEKNLDLLVPPVRKQPFDEFLGLPIANILSSRGCTHACDFCSIAAWHKLCGGKRHRFRSVEGVAEEIAELYFQGVRIFNFHDDNFLPTGRNQCLERVSNIRDALVKKNVGRIAFAIKARPDEVDEEIFALLHEMGLFRVFLGIEAGTAKSLDALGRGQTTDQNETALQIVNKLGLHCCFNLLLLNPSSTLEDFKSNVDFLVKHPINPMNFCRTEIYAGTPLERRMNIAGRLTGDYWGFDYAIADHRAEKLFQLVFPAFRDRCHGINALHHLTMAVDYENQLFEHFYMRDTRLHNRVKTFVADVNLNTCTYLDELARIFGNDVSLSIRETLVEVRERLDADTDQLQKQGLMILQDIRKKADICRFHFRATWGGKVRSATAVGLIAAATIGVSTAEDSTQKAKADSLKKVKLSEQIRILGNSHVFEMAAQPAQQRIIRSFTPQALKDNKRNMVSIEMKFRELKRVELDTLYSSWIMKYSRYFIPGHFQAFFIIKTDGAIKKISINCLNQISEKNTGNKNGKIPFDDFENMLSKKIANLSFPPIDSGGAVKVQCDFDFKY